MTDRSSTTEVDPDLALTVPSELVTDAEASSLLTEHYGLDGFSVERLSGEVDGNFAVSAGAQRYLLKVVHRLTPVDLVAAQTAVLVHVRTAAPQVPVASVLPTRDGAEHVVVPGGRLAGRPVYLTSFLPGRASKDVSISTELRRDIGATLARLSLAMADFDHPAAHRDVLWDISRASRLHPYIDELPADRDAALLRRLLDEFTADTAPRLAALRQQVVHNDFGSDNVLVDESGLHVSGVVDFGDMCRTAVANDLAIAATYRLGDGPRLFADAVDVIAGYHAVRPLQSGEIDLLPDLVMARMVLRITVTEWRAATFPENAPYILRNTPRAWEQLYALADLPRPVLRDQIRRRLEEEDGAA